MLNGGDSMAILSITMVNIPSKYQIQSMSNLNNNEAMSEMSCHKCANQDHGADSILPKLCLAFHHRPGHR
jgi:hypothetical protein